MTDDLERRLHDRLSAPLPPAPVSLVSRSERLWIEHPRGHAGRRWRVGAVAKVAVVAVAIVLVGVLLPRQGPSTPPETSPPPTRSDGSPIASTAPTAVTTPTALPPGSWTVSEFISHRDAGTLPEGPITVRGYWTDRSMAHSCPAPPPEYEGELYGGCHDGEYGITERDEPIRTWNLRGASSVASGPWITPYIENDESMLPLFTQPVINGQAYPPVPIVAVGHVNDSRADACGSAVIQICRDRLVIDEVLVFDPRSVPTPAPTPSPTPFPFEDPPPARFDKDMCAGDVPYAFVGWGKLSDYGVLDRGDEVVFLMATRDPENLPGETGPPRRIVCFSYEWDEGLVINFAFLP